MSVFLRHAREIAYEHKTPLHTHTLSIYPAAHSELAAGNIAFCSWRSIIMPPSILYVLCSKRGTREMSSAIMLQIRMGGYLMIFNQCAQLTSCITISNC